MSATIDSELGGLAGADAKCQAAADASSIVPEGTYLAWLSDSTGSPSTRFTRSTVPYVLPTGATVANNYSDLTDGTLINPINIDESGMQIPPLFNTNPTFVWTNTSIGGLAASIFFSASCSDWERSDFLDQAIVGDPILSTDNNWTAKQGADTCDQPGNHLYCFQQ